MSSKDRYAARDVIAKWPDEGTPNSRVRKGLAHAALLYARRQRAEAHKTLKSALSVAAEFQLVQPLAEMGEPMMALLHQGNGQALGPAQSDIVVRARTALTSAGSTAVNLTPRETMVMRRLAGGATLPGLAKAMHLSLNTVKTHTRSIYKKLGVSSRQKAIEAWRETAGETNSD